MCVKCWSCGRNSSFSSGGSAGLLTAVRARAHGPPSLTLNSPCGVRDYLPLTAVRLLNQLLEFFGTPCSSVLGADALRRALANAAQFSIVNIAQIANHVVRRCR